METPLSVDEFAAYFLNGPRHVSCLIAEDEATGSLCGFQALERDPQLPEGWADIATFARVEPKVPGVGTALFAATKRRAAELGLIALNATIRADNTSGLAFYSKMGFEDYRVTKGVPLKDGTPVDRVSKRCCIDRRQACSA